mmetsp:Transcript_12184/g.29037  ORF Transcript_12184/g.29037 Transcript_12184/m.29037 type:complete len:313 (+) Transcript_12184:223-1161(+)|eukprot:CAMPEP_0113625252 /NCGR_PEP_ID=MMETSP0017_2-20120614/13044_1 /TAXON_ID=2856 /ORGANISM="Cylindrotheca closterium" /LENGTH=312 /DNA_ID=CAMNT_0000535361 /DNA_START=140 /DNA_END=1078 /DNA_ORIENTATION=- /assembly_acc=CAM_ASM_000147
MYNFYLRRKALDEQHVRRQDPTTYTQPLEGTPITEQFISEFANKIHQKEEMDFYSKEQAKYPDLKLHYEKLVPSEVSYEEFWRRYEYRTDLNRIMDEMKGSRMSQSSTEVAKREIHSLRRKIFNRLNVNGDAAPPTSDSSGEQEYEQNGKESDDPVLQEIESTSDSDYSDFDGADIHMYPDKLEVEDAVVELDLDLSASEFDGDAIEELGMESHIHIYPDSIQEENEGIHPGALKEMMVDRIRDSDCGSLEYDSEFGSLAPIVDPTEAPSEIDEEVKMLEEVYDEDALIEHEAYQDDQSGEDDKCNCLCVIS